MKTKAKTTIEVNLDLVANTDLTVEEYILLLLIHRKDELYIKKLFTVFVPNSLRVKGYLTEANELTNKASILLGGITITEETGLTKLKETYPKSELRRGQRVPLQKSAKGIQISYHKTIGNDIKRFDRMIKALKYMLNQRDLAGDKAQFLPDLQVWLNQEQWKSYEEVSSEEGKFDGGNLSINL